MKVMKLDNMVRGWFVGGFEPSVLKTLDVEVGVKEYKAGDVEVKHFHKIASEITVVLTGEISLNGCVYNKGDIILLEPGEHADFEALTDSINVVVKHPGASNDKYLSGEGDA